MSIIHDDTLARFPYFWLLICLCAGLGNDLHGQEAPYDTYPDAKPPYYRVRFEAETEPGQLIFPVNYTVWIPPGIKTLRGVVVHQHGCGEGSCRSGLTGAYDLHWQALARKHACALLAPAYEQPQKADCQMWCDPRNGSAVAFQKGLKELGKLSGHPELAKIPWALWGHSGGGHWAGGMALLHPERVAAAWLRSGVPLFEANPDRPQIKPHDLPDAALEIPIMCNPGTKEGVTVKTGRFAKVWPANEKFIFAMRAQDALVGVAVDPLTAHECGNQRYLAIRWLDECLSLRLPDDPNQPLKRLDRKTGWLSEPAGQVAYPLAEYPHDQKQAAWLPNKRTAELWTQYVKDTAVSDSTPPPAPTKVQLTGNVLRWSAQADVESGLAKFIVRRNGKFLANVPGNAKNRFGRPLFQNLQYSDTPTQPLVPMLFTDQTAEPGKSYEYQVLSVNTVGLKSKPTAAETER